MATCYNPTNSQKNISIIYSKNKNNSQLNELTKDFFGKYNFSNNNYDLPKYKEDKSKYIQSIINSGNTNENKNGRIYWDIEAQKFLIE